MRRYVVVLECLCGANEATGMMVLKSKSVDEFSREFESLPVPFYALVPR